MYLLPPFISSLAVYFLVSDTPWSSFSTALLPCIPLIHFPLFLSLPVRKLFISMIESLFTSSQTWTLTGMWVFIFSMYHLYNVGGWGGGGGAFDPEIFSNLMSCLLTAIYSIVSHWHYPPPAHHPPQVPPPAVSRLLSPPRPPLTARPSLHRKGAH